MSKNMKTWFQNIKKTTLFETSEDEASKQSEQDEVWERKRSLTTKAFCFASFVLGMEQAMIVVTLWLYLKPLVKPKYQIAYYSLISVTYTISGIVVSLILCRYQDRARRVRRTLLWCNTMMLTGNIIYSAPPVSPAFPFIGRLLAGAGQAFHPLMSAEVARCYDATSAISVFSVLGLTGAFGFLFGAIMNFALVFLDVSVETYRITYANAPGIYMAVACFAMEFLIFFAVSDLSRTYDPKGKQESSAVDTAPSSVRYTGDQKVQFLDDEPTQTDLLATDVPEKSKKENSLLVRSSSVEESREMRVVRRELSRRVLRSTKTTLRVVAKLFTKFDVVTILGCSFLFSFVIISIKMWLPLLVVETLHWGIEELNLIMLGSAATSVALLITLWLTSPSHSSLYKISLLSTFVVALLLAVIILVKVFEKVVAVGVLGFIMFGIIYGFVVTLEDVFLVSTLAQMVPSKVQSFAESIRLSFTQVGGILALLLTEPTFSVVVSSSGAMLMLTMSAFCILIARKDNLIRPTLLVRTEDGHTEAEE